MTTPRSAQIAESFGARAESYERHAALQRDVAERLARRLPRLESPRVLELGCGTGLLTRLLLQAYPDGDFLITDLSPAMIATAKANIRSPAGARLAFDVMDAAHIADVGRFDLVVTSMSLHWLTDPAAALTRLRELLNPGGAIVYSALGEDCFAEWRAAVAAEGLADGIVPIAPLPGAEDEESLVMEESGLAFLRRLRAIGGLTPREGYAPLSPGALRRVLSRLDRDHGGQVTWHIVYGRLSSMESSAAASRSRPSMIPS
ncbi:Malonyl-[acyl-carrier protein] O-methyltransferase [Methyloligella halotolerans]|uniref:Malonyl-[acyl-carrier protein] O-methyltransferase n=1 Tax=Methyloligella halotolerans TaxID=1177755 RepID=A0A1E2S3M9_9HYPH|nr:methyltransferase [Methyloligella halotolerans]ODA68939.1 Malonyl-[acyl-carrier protein] O-methyltransferase [Methyloligella halotolerans]